MAKRSYLAALYAAFGVAVPLGATMAQVSPAIPAAPAFTPFAAFAASLHSASAAQMMAQQGAGVKVATAAEEMRQHLLNTYEGVSVKQSYALDDQIFDCVPIGQQPSVRLLGLQTVSAPPPAPPVPVSGSPFDDTGVGAHIAVQKSATGRDAYGHEQSCAAGTIPMRRITLQEISRFETLQKFFDKGPNGAGRVQQKQGGGTVPPATNGHSYAHEYQNVNNYGGYSALSLYRPYVNTALNEIFSLSQQWYVAWTPVLQTAEIGIQNYPAKYGSENSALFIYWTADGYNSTGCYNLDCAGFVQTNSNWHLGGGFTNYSTVGGAQYEVALGFYFYQGNWWMAAGSDWVGYYPGSLYRGGPLSQYATEFDLGGESVGSTVWPPMGSGQFAIRGYPYSAYHRAIVYRDANNGGHYPSLTVSQPPPACQTATPEQWGGTTWQYYFYFGGPGGKNC
jgi:Neprosin